MGFFWFVIGCLAGWLFAHSTIAHECETVGKFYVGSKVYECVKIKSMENLND